MYEMFVFNNTALDIWIQQQEYTYKKYIKRHTMGSVRAYALIDFSREMNGFPKMLIFCTAHQ